MRIMKCITKRIAVIVLSAALLLSLIPITAFAAENPSGAEALLPDETIVISSEDGEDVIYSFTPEEDGIYIIESSGQGDSDPRVRLYDSKMAEIDSADDNDGDSNFVLQCDLSGGQIYYFEFSNYNDEGFSYQVSLRKSDYVHVTYHVNHKSAFFYGEYDEAKEDYTKVDSRKEIFEDGEEIDPWYVWPDSSDSSIDFVGWADNPNATEPDEEIFAKDGLDLYAVWKQVNMVTFDLNGVGLDQAYYIEWNSESEDEEHVSRIVRRCASGEQVYPEWPEIIDDSLELAGWSEDKDALEPDEVIIANDDTTFYAVWRHTYTVTFDANGGYVDYDYEMQEPLKTSEYSYYEGQGIDLITPSHSDYTKIFDGWYDQKSGGKKVTQNQIVTGNITLYAHWSDAKTEIISPDTVTQAKAGASQFVYQFTPSETGVYLLNSAAVDNHLYPEVSLYEGDKKINIDTETFDGKDFLLTCELEKGKTYAFVIKNENQSINAYPVKIVKAASAKVTFDTNRKGVTFVNNNKNEIARQSAIGSSVNRSNLEMNIPESDDVLFAGWSPDPDATEAEYDLTVSGDMTLYAVWKNTCYVTFDANGGYFYDGDHTSDTIQGRYTEGDYIGYYDHPNSNEEDYLFLGWSKDKGATVADPQIKAESGLTLYAVWAERETYVDPDTVQVTFEVNNGKASFEDSQKTITQRIAKGEILSIYDNVPDTNDTTLKFVGWSKDKDATEADDRIVATDNLTVYAVWKKSVTITFDTNGVSLADAYFEQWDKGEHIKSQVYSRKYVKGDSIYIYGNEPDVINGRLRFMGWSTKKDATEAEDDIIVGDKPLTLYAVWGSNAIVTFDANGGYFYRGSIYNIKIKKGDLFDYYSTPKNYDPQKVFAGWATTPNAAEPDLDYDTKVTDDMTVYAVWKEGVKVTINANGGYFLENGKKLSTIDTYVLPGSYVSNIDEYAYHTDDLKRDWGKKALSSTGDAIPGNTKINNATTLYVKWVDLVRVTFDAQEGTFEDERTITETIEKGENWHIGTYRQATSDDVNKTFVGWSTKKGDESAVVNTIKTDRDIILYAIYREGYKVILDSADISMGSPYAMVNGKAIDSDTKDKSFIWPKDVPASDLILGGSSYKGDVIFLGYSTSKDRKDIIADDWTPKKDNITLYAIFAEGYTIEFWANGGSFGDGDDEYVSLQVEKGEAIGAVEDPTPPDGKVFAGWEYYEYNSATDTRTWKMVDYDLASYKPQRYIFYRAVFTDESKQVLKDVSISPESTDYTGSAIQPNVTVKYGGKVLKQDTDYTVAYSNNVNAGKATVTVVGKGDYSGEVTKNFTINPADIANATVSAPTVTWNGAAQKPAVTVKYSGKTLSGTNDYSAAYSSNISAGNGIVTITGKGNYTGNKAATFRIQFRDVTDQSKFYYEPIYWAVDYRGITKGWEDGTFRYMNDCTRAAVVTFMWRHAGSPSPKSKAKFKDMTGNADFDNAISWAVENGIVKGWDDGTFRPWKTCNRAAMMTFFYRYAGSPKVTGSNIFKDKTGNAEFDRAIAWGVSKGITTGWSDGTFRPWTNCNRLATVTFLYRYHNSKK